MVFIKTYIKKLFFIFSILLSSFILVACNKDADADIITTLYPQYDIAKNIVGNKKEVKLLTPFGSEVHDFSPTAKDIVNIRKADLFIYTSDIMEPWVKDILTESTHSINLSTSYTLVPYKNNALVDDIHFWTDPLIIIDLVKVIKQSIIKIDPENELFYEENASAYINKINKVHDDLLNLGNKQTIFFYGHNALASFGARYELNIISLSGNYKPDAELQPSQLENLKKAIIQNNAHFLFVGELIDLKGPNTLVSDLKKSGYQLTLLELHGFHNISLEQSKEGLTYAQLLERNYINLKQAFDSAN
ncbi:Metal ion ABC transport system, periplasmic component/surface adhesin [Alteracholeplasma palmae J233]|uniref:Metal ion ABC transport system, periplasmic component/surface adhesin n=1 Tax=Alteracholeplasma palmae (strain ATCC 49389 / J233) TaxID=1318466 RepID=U4KKN1_ALTPJ|nr:metal ABC transporter substrate-binding protein [Alteracholeplasma palmae]CCV64178.1 Metal ion ABC transport system, periplasmic component/surface adhesin [Alteracholeplasma palmae J233]